MNWTPFSSRNNISGFGNTATVYVQQSAAEFGAEYAISTTINNQEVKGKVGEFSVDRLTSPY